MLLNKLWQGPAEGEREEDRRSGDREEKFDLGVKRGDRLCEHMYWEAQDLVNRLCKLLPAARLARHWNQVPMYQLPSIFAGMLFLVSNQLTKIRPPSLPLSLPPNTFFASVYTDFT